MGSSHDEEGPSSHLNLQQRVELDDVPSRRDILTNEQKRATRFSSIDVMANGTISISSSEFTLPSYFSVDLSTEENYRELHSDDLDFYGDYECVRKTLDYSYHGVSTQ